MQSIRARPQSIRRLGAVDIAAHPRRYPGHPEAVWDAENSSKPNAFEALDARATSCSASSTVRRDWRSPTTGRCGQAWREQLQPVLAQATRAYGYARGTFPRVMLARMAPGGIIRPHVDANVAASWPHKIHVPILTNDQVAFLVGDTEYHFPEGEAVEVNNMGMHAVRNDGASDRIHLIFEYYDLDQPDPDWIR